MFNTVVVNCNSCRERHVGKKNLKKELYKYTYPHTYGGGIHVDFTRKAKKVEVEEWKGDKMRITHSCLVSTNMSVITWQKMIGLS